MAITRLDKKTVEQIAAGEVIESPVSIVKELVENSIDAKASSITVEIKNGGKTYIRVTDDGTGIEATDIALAFEKHATSKISNFEDLYDIYTNGFRGEALASIVSVSDVVAISKTEDTKIGTKITFKNSISSQSSIATNTGTSIEVIDLFKNIPVRYKFLKSDLAETNAISKLMYSLALGNPKVAFKYIKDGRIEFKTSKDEDLYTRIINLLDDNLKENLIKINSNSGVYKVSGFVSSSNYYRGSRSFEYLYVNNRLVDSQVITNAIESEYRSYIPQGRFPAFMIFIDTNPKNIDVNVHPNKKTIKFNYEDELLDLIGKTVYEKLFESKSANRIEIEDKKSNDLLDFSDYAKVLDHYKSPSFVREEPPSYEANSFFENMPSDNNDILQENIVESDKIIEENIKNESFIKEDNHKYITSIFARYSLFESSDGEISLLDHRRAEEAVLFDSYLHEIDNRKTASQLLLEPLIVNLKADDRDNYQKKASFINQIGFDIENYGENQIIIRSIPFIFENPELEILFYEILDLPFESSKDILNKNLFKIVKKHAFRKGHKINKDEAISLLNKIFKLDNPYKTFEGKSTMVTLSQTDLEKYFDR